MTAMQRWFGALLWSAFLSAQAADMNWREAQQIIVVTTADWDSTAGQLRTYERRDQHWKEVAEARAVTIGRAGAAWGLGLHPMPQPGPIKQEGDGRSPAGIFGIAMAFGYERSASTKLRYQEMTESDYCIDVSSSSQYNRIVDANVVGQTVVQESTEPMRRDLHADGDQRYKLGFVISHNASGKPAAGSCIFAHLWRRPDETTAGCTAMSEPDMQQLLAWLDQERQPAFVLLPRAAYERLRSSWHLP